MSHNQISHPMMAFSNGTTTINLSEFRKHSSEASCWIIIQKNVWDITAYLSSHPGGSEIILRYAGDDATSAYNEVHAPSIIENTLPKDKLVGRVTDADLVSLLKIRKVATPPGSQEQPYRKPTLQAILNSHDFEKVAKRTISPKAWAFYSSAATDLVSHRLNTQIYSRVMFRPRVLRPVLEVDVSSSMLGISTSLPIFVAPAAMARLAHPDGELALARGAKGEGIIQTISTNASYPLNEIVRTVSNEESPHPWFLQLYVNRDRLKTEELLIHAVKLGVRAIFLTVDSPVAGKREADERLAHDISLKAPISGGGSQSSFDTKGGGLARKMGLYIDSNLQWSDIPWIAECLIQGQKLAGQDGKDRIPIVIKGIQTAADTRKALGYLDSGVKGVFLSNHGGRSLDTSPPGIVTLLECWKVCPEVFRKLEIYVDGGIRRGTDVVKAIALGAKAVGIGRPFLYSLSYGEEGVRRLIDIFRDEVKVTMQMLGVTDIAQLHPGLINTRDIDHLVPGVEEDGEREMRHPYAGFQGLKSKL